LKFFPGYHAAVRDFIALFLSAGVPPAEKVSEVGMKLLSRINMAQGEHTRCTSARSMNILDATLTRIARDSLSRSLARARAR